jgi:hypothetical protein
MAIGPGVPGSRNPFTLSKGYRRDPSRDPFDASTRDLPTHLLSPAEALLPYAYCERREAPGTTLLPLLQTDKISQHDMGLMRR